MLLRIAATTVVLFVFTSLLSGQPVPFLSEEEYDWLSNEISGDAAYEHIRHFTQFHRGGGTPGLMEVAKYVERKAREYGLKRVRLIKQDYPRAGWACRYGEIWITSPQIQLLASTNQVRLHLADYSRTAHLQDIALIHVGSGTQEGDYEGKEVEGKIVVAFGSSNQVMRQAVWERGALGIVSYPNPSVAGYPANSLDHPDQIHWGRIPVDDGEGKKGTFGFLLSARQGLQLVNLLQAEEPVKAQVDIEAEFSDEKWQVMVEAYVPGAEISNQDVVLTGHLQEEKFSANDDSSGCASVLEIGRALTRLIQDGKIQAPRRNIRLWWVTEISSQRQYFADHPEAHRSMMVNINQDMVGANQGQDVLRTQNMTRVPFSNFHFLNDVSESVLEFVIEGNRSNLSVIQAGFQGLYPRPILSKLGTRHRYHAEIIPVHLNSDHMTFSEAPIGVPGITFTNWPDNYIHTSDDDLWNVDPTQLQRNAVAVAMIGYTIAAADKELFGGIAAEVAGRAQQRLGTDYRLALGWINDSEDRYPEGLFQVQEAVKREKQAVASLGEISESDDQEKQITGLMSQLSGTGENLENGLNRFFKTRWGTAPRIPDLTEEEQKLYGLRPTLSGGPAEFLEKRREVSRVSGLHGVMAFEVAAFVDGERSGLEIFRAVAAEARRAGSHYYGTVEPGEVLEYLGNMEKEGLVTFDQKH